SHNINRLPARLRAKAAREAFKSAPGSKLVRKKIKKIKTPKNTVQEFLRRQKSKKWLETHMWHTKRMKMNDIWGYRIASRPNTKSVRITYRSFTRLSIVHDASYMGCIELKGNTEEIIRALDTVTDAGSPSVGSERYIKGNRLGSTHLYEYLGYPTKLICPITFLWKPSKDALWLWAHPSAFNEAMIFIKKALQETKSNNVHISDLRDDILRFDLTGPRSTALLQAILDPVADQDIKGNQVWQDLSQLRSSSSLSPGSVIGLVVNDPRLRFPQKVPPRTNEISAKEQQNIMHILENWPKDIADTSIWDKQTREMLFNTRIPEYALNLRRENNMIPGTKLEPTAEDSKIPILLIQRGEPAFNTPNVVQNSLASNEYIQGWTLILPRGFGMAFWKSLIFAGARVAGYDDIRAMHFESGFPSFPQDYPGTRAFEAHRSFIKTSLESAWQKRPPAKRVNYKKRGIDHPFECAFETLSSVEHMEIEPECNLPIRPHYALIHGRPFVSSVISDSEDYNQKLELYSTKQGIHLQPLILEDALVKIRLRYIDRGKPAPNALVYMIRDNEIYNQCASAVRCRSSIKANKRKLKEFIEAQSDRKKEPIPMPTRADHIGYITKGDFSLSLGYGFGIGACTVTSIREIDSLDQL
ncbi:hypothetical protein CU098_000584, partial [Rhizopus stolonifer]